MCEATPDFRGLLHMEMNNPNILELGIAGKEIVQLAPLKAYCLRKLFCKRNRVSKQVRSREVETL